jgi:CDP-diacylglycerol pyrophosphatase
MATESNPNHAGVNRRRFLLTSGAVGAGTLAAGMSSWPAVGDPAVSPPPFVPPHGCGDPNDKGVKVDLWTVVKGTTPAHPGLNIAVVEPDTKKNTYAVHNGNGTKDTYKYNLLIIPVTRVTGVECDKIIDDKTFLNLWPWAFKEAQKAFPGKDVIAGINSMDGRSKDQLHIHLTEFYHPARQMIDTLTITSHEGDWNKTSEMHILPGSPNPPDPKKDPVPFAYRILHVNNLDSNLFALMKSNISSGKNNDMFAQSLAVVTAPKAKGGYYLINTQGNVSQKGQPPHDPDLRVGKVFGTQTVEALFYRG